ncbi:hypothetical protein BC829DRAFT_384252 [Chytridium lagenaria]|nr:hypothetical protein BC829DRAFT_384252 [Chytridium lagenaria]
MMQDGYAFTECFTRLELIFPQVFLWSIREYGEHMGDDHDLYAFETFEVDPKPKKTKKRISKLDHQTEEKIEDIKKAINEAQKKQEKMPGQLGFQEILSPKVLNDLLESQFRVIDNLNLLHGKAGLAPIIAAGVHERATEHVKNAVGSVDATVDAIAKKVDDVSSQVKALSDNVQELFIAFREFNTQGDQGIREVNDKLQASQEKLQAAHQAIKDAPSSSHWGFSLSFFMLGGIIVYAASVFVRMGKNDSKRFV